MHFAVQFFLIRFFYEITLYYNYNSGTQVYFKSRITHNHNHPSQMGKFSDISSWCTLTQQVSFWRCAAIPNFIRSRLRSGCYASSAATEVLLRAFRRPVVFDLQYFVRKILIFTTSARKFTSNHIILVHICASSRRHTVFLA